MRVSDVRTPALTETIGNPMHPKKLDRFAAFIAVLDARGWRLGRNLQIDYRWGAGNGELYRSYS